MDIRGLPPQPPESSWRFVDELRQPMWSDHGWSPRAARADEADLSSGIGMDRRYNDPRERLDTAIADLGAFCAAGRVPTTGPAALCLAVEEDLGEEAFELRVEPGRVSLAGGDLEGLRRGVFHLEDLMLAAGGPFLPLGVHQRRPFIRRRYSRCFFGPIKRPPRLRDELMDDVDYYPDHYLNRLAHDGVNGLWLTVEFRDLCRTSLTSGNGADAARRFAKLRQTIDSCLRHGIRTYLFCIEPRAWEVGDPALAAHPEMGRAAMGRDRRLFCPFSDASRRYLRECTETIFRNAPDLGGIINITHGERPTTCLSQVTATGIGDVTCPVCATKEPWEILHASLTAMEQGMHAVAPDADLVSWLYMPQERGPFQDDLADWVYEIPKHTPPGVILQSNFETGVTREDFGREITGGDYWLSEPGPSSRFVRVAEAARAAGTPVSAKIQNGCSHEVATAPYIPVPSLLFEKYSAMRDLGVSQAMLCWYFGNYPGLMNRAGCRLCFEPFPESDEALLRELAARDWGEDAPTVTRAWQCFASGYRRFPLTNYFQYYGPMPDGPVWPLLLKPEDAMLSPTWLLGNTITREPWPPSGDRIGEALGPYSLTEGIELCRELSECWDLGLGLLAGVRAPNRARELDLGVAEALGIQFRSGWRILRFYDARERLFRMDGVERLPLLAEMRDIVESELSGGDRLLELCEADSRLGFHSEAEGYKYFPAKIRWRQTQLRRCLDEDFPVVEAAIRDGRVLFPEYTGLRPTGPTARCVFARNAERAFRSADLSTLAELDWCSSCFSGDDPAPLHWASVRDGAALYLFARTALTVGLDEPHGDFAVEARGGRACVVLRLEERRLWPSRYFAAGVAGGRSTSEEFEATSWQDGSARVVALRLPFATLRRAPDCLDPVRIDVQMIHPGRGRQHWLQPTPFPYRLRFGSDNPADLGWLVMA